MAPASSRWSAAGFLVFDVVLTVALLMLLVLMFSMAARQYAATQRDSDTRRMLRLAAEAELARLRAGSTPLPSPSGSPQTKTIGAIRVETAARAGKGQWRGFTHVRVVARKQVQGYWATVELSAYLHPPSLKGWGTPEGWGTGREVEP